MRPDPHRLREYRPPSPPPAPKPTDGPPHDPYVENEGLEERSKVHRTHGHNGLVIETIGRAMRY